MIWQNGNGVDGSILHTTDGGEGWKLQHTSQGRPLYALSFASASVGWAVGHRATVLYTLDGGVTWDTSQVSSNSDLYAVSGDLVSDQVSPIPKP